MSLSEVILRAMLTLPVYSEDVEAAEAKRAQLTAVAEAIADASGDQSIVSSRDWAALMVAVGYAESGFSLRIHAGLCKPHECDRGKARGPFQLHRYAEAVPVWEKMHGLEHVKVQALVASSRLTRGYYTCRSRDGATDWLMATLNGYAGRACKVVWPGLETRVAIWRRVRKAMEGRA